MHAVNSKLQIHIQAAFDSIPFMRVILSDKLRASNSPSVRRNSTAIGNTMHGRPRTEHVALQ